MVLIVLLGVTALAPAVLDLRRSLEDLRGAALMEQRNQVAAACLQVVNDFAFERGRTAVALFGADKASEETLAFIRERRAGAERGMERLSAALDGLSGVSGAETLRAWDAVLVLRAESDAAMALPFSARDPSLAGRWLLTAADLLAHLEFLLAELGRAPGADGLYERVCALRVAVVQFRNVVGRESMMVASVTAGVEKVDEAFMNRLLLLRGRSAQLWEQIRQEALLSGGAGFSTALENTRRAFFEGLRPLQESILLGGAHGTELPPPAAYTKESVRALDSIITSLDTVSEDADRVVRHNLATARRTAAGGLVGILAAAVLVAVSARVIARRITRPLRDIVERIDRLRDPGASLQLSGVRDEFTTVRHALDLLDHMLAARERDARALQEANRRLAELAETDELTGLANRRRLNAALAAEWARARRDARPLTLLMIDVDHFKRYNDALGHQAGDERLIDVGRAIRGLARRPGDVAARYGGEEYVLLLPDLPSSKALAHAEEVRQAVEALNLPHEGSPHARVTVSIGMATLTPCGESRAEDLVRLADDALYEAKRLGRNRVEAAPAGAAADCPPPVAGRDPA
ncbi:GGDEF domain-containing protein [Fundidesulfovibrio magnetotacticus]|nr:diguanylate cyclase [Fundidesulfovibrio magnetotacticus]